MYAYCEVIILYYLQRLTLNKPLQLASGQQVSALRLQG